ncbi:hypothetical protein V6N12_075014 [Hibiscus sabdariffa]|uniref:Uncharacterized protein n=1 Tax=Hibiscus sabdariffa TaxID=183260 RepID=A0ABR2BZB7_9ROSI
MQSSIDDGGLGFKDVYQHNRAFLMEIGYQLGLSNIWDELKESVNWNIRGGQQTDFWYDNWLRSYGRPVFECVLDTTPRPTLVSDMVLPNGNWDWDRVQEVANQLATLPLDEWLHGNITGSLVAAVGGVDWGMRFSIFCWLLWKVMCSMVLDGDYVERESVFNQGNRLILEWNVDATVSMRDSGVGRSEFARFLGSGMLLRINLLAWVGDIHSREGSLMFHRDWWPCSLLRNNSIRRSRERHVLRVFKIVAG